MTRSELKLMRDLIRTIRASARGTGILGPAALNLCNAAEVLTADHGRVLDEIERLRADKRTLIDQLRHIRTHLYAATVQRSPADDKIIADHIEQAYLRANEVIAEMEKAND